MIEILATMNTNQHQQRSRPLVNRLLKMEQTRKYKYETRATYIASASKTLLILGAYSLSTHYPVVRARTMLGLYRFYLLARHRLILPYSSVRASVVQS